MIFVKENLRIGYHWWIFHSGTVLLVQKAQKKHEVKVRFSKFFKVLYGFRWNLLLKALMKMRFY